jgi:hypothetical protein
VFEGISKNAYLVFQERRRGKFMQLECDNSRPDPDFAPILLSLRIKQSTDAASLADAQVKLLEAQLKLKKAVEDANK